MSDAIGYRSQAWLGPSGTIQHAGDASMAVQSTRLKRLIPALVTPAWAVHCDLQGPGPDRIRLLKEIARGPSAVKVLDVIDATPEDAEALHGWTHVTRHTRHLDLPPSAEVIPWPSHRLKQERRFLREGGCVEVNPANGWQEVRSLHLQSRARKSLDGRPEALTALLENLSHEPWAYNVVAYDREGNPVASGGFVGLSNGTTVYAFGGQQRSKASGLASVAMVMAAGKAAQGRGSHVLDFGGSLDPGVDRFYKELGGKAVAVSRFIQCPLWFRRMFPGTWRAWTQQSTLV